MHNFQPHLSGVVTVCASKDNILKILSHAFFPCTYAIDTQITLQ